MCIACRRDPPHHRLFGGAVTAIAIYMLVNTYLSTVLGILLIRLNRRVQALEQNADRVADVVEPI
jgi:hypothetical protein